MPAKKKARMARGKPASPDKVTGHMLGMVDAIIEHADNVASYGTGTLQHEGEDIKALAKELQDFLEKTPMQRRKTVARDLRYYNRWQGSKK